MNKKNPWTFILGVGTGRNAFLGYLRNLTPQIVLATACALLYIRGTCIPGADRLIWVAAVLAIVWLLAAIANGLDFTGAMSEELTRRAELYKECLQKDTVSKNEDAQQETASTENEGHKKMTQFQYLFRNEKLLLVEALFVVFVPYLCFIAVLVIASGQVRSSVLAQCP